MINISNSIVFICNNSNQIQKYNGRERLQENNAFVKRQKLFQSTEIVIIYLLL